MFYKIKFSLFVIPPFLHDKGISLGTSYDANYQFTYAIDSISNLKYESINL